MAERELYSIPTRSSWFDWDAIHPLERQALPDFFDGASPSKTPTVYKHYRDFIISKYRQDPARRLPFSLLRPSLLGDVSSLYAVFRFLDRCGLINANAAPPSSPAARAQVLVEDALLPGIRVLEFPTSSAKVISSLSPPPPALFPASALRFSPLTSYADAFLPPRRPSHPPLCALCLDKCHAHYYLSEKDRFTICVRCFQDEKFGENKSASDYLLKNTDEESISPNPAAWDDSDTMILLDAVVKNGDDWSAVLQQVENKSKIDCISRILELPFNDTMSASSEYKDLDGDAKDLEFTLGAPQDDTGNMHSNHVDKNHGMSSADEDAALHPPKRKRPTVFSDIDNPLVKQSARMCALVGTDVTAAAAEAAISALGRENPDAKKILDSVDVGETEKDSYALSSESQRLVASKNSKTDKIRDNSETPESSLGNGSASVLKLRAAVATTFGAASANAKLLADQELREIEHLFAIMLEAQMKKVEYKMKYFNDLESILEKEYEYIQQVKEIVLGERINVSKRKFSKVGDDRFSKPVMSQ